MTSAIDATKPTTGVAYTADVRANFLTAKNEITALQTNNTGINTGDQTNISGTAAIATTVNTTATTDNASYFPVIVEGVPGAVPSQYATTFSYWPSIACLTVNGINLWVGGGGVLSNIGIGSSVLASNTTGNSNTAVGYQSFVTNIIGTKNTTVGCTAGYRITGGSNSAFGNQALYYTSTGNNNIGIGESAGGYSSGVYNTTGSNNIYIGSLTQSASNADNNSITIGHSSVSLGTNTTVIGNSSTTSTQIFGNVTTTGVLNLTGASSGQIQFPAAQHASSGVNVLDDYEEGTWTPTDASGAGLTFTSPSGEYTKIGRLVHVTAVFTYPVTADGSVPLIGGFPFVFNKFSPGSAYVAGLVSTAFGISGTSSAYVLINGATTTNVTLSTCVVYMNITYETAT